MTWFLYALATAVFVSLQDALNKRFFGHRSPLEMFSFLLLYSLPGCLVGLWLTPVPELDSTFWWAFALGIPVNGLGMVLYYRAIKQSPLSLTMPLLAFSPAFLILVGWVLLGESLTLFGILGILVIVSGSYLLHFRLQQGGGASLFAAPFAALMADPGSRAMLWAALIFAVGAALGKMAIGHSNALFFAFSFFSAHNLTILLFFLATRQVRLGYLLSQWRLGLVVGNLYFLHITCHNLAVALTKTAYMISVKRLNLVFSVFLGRWVLGERDTGQRALAALAMLAGVVILYLLG